MRFPFHFCAGCFVAVASLCSPKSCPANPTGDEVVRKMQSVDSARELGDAYWHLFQDSTDEQTKALESHSNQGVAIQASWEQIRRVIGTLPKMKFTEENQGRILVDPKLLHRFLGFIEGRLRLTVPEEWEKQMLLATAIPGDPLSVVPGSAPFPDEPTGRGGRPTSYYDTDIGLQTAIGLRLHETNDAIIITRKSDRKTFLVSKTALDVAAKGYRFLFEPSLYGDSTGDMRKINLIDTDKKYFVVYHGIQYHGRYPLFCFKKDSSKLLWTSDVISFEGGGGLTGAGFYHWTEMKVADDHILVFGAGHISMYIEAFSIADGSCLFRFNTPYGEDEPW